MTRFVAAGAVPYVVAAAAPAYGAPRKSPKLLCKQVRDAVWAGHTLEQLTAEFQIDAQHVMKCLKSGKGKKPKAKKGKKKAPAQTHAAKKQ